MRLKTAALIAALFVPFCGASAAYAQPQTASGFWASPYSRSTDQQAIDQRRAESQMQARNGGFGPAQQTVNYNGDVTSNSTYNGTVMNSGATNIVNSNSTSVNNSGASSLITVTTGQTSGSANQQAGSQATTIGTGSQGGINQGPRN